MEDNRKEVEKKFIEACNNNIKVTSELKNYEDIALENNLNPYALYEEAQKNIDIGDR